MHRQSFDHRSPSGEESLLLHDLVALVSLGLLEEHPSPDGPVFALTELGRETPEFGAGSRVA
jgi:hypothetical protein